MLVITRNMLRKNVFKKIAFSTKKVRIFTTKFGTLANRLGSKNLKNGSTQSFLSVFNRFLKEHEMFIKMNGGLILGNFTRPQRYTLRSFHLTLNWNLPVKLLCIAAPPLATSASRASCSTSSSLPAGWTTCRRRTWQRAAVPRWRGGTRPDDMHMRLSTLTILQCHDY